jgi:hypothetical protein
MAVIRTEEPTGWVGWIYFAGFMMIMLGVFQSIAGLTALLNDTFYVAHQGKLLVLDYTQWGWIHLLMGILIIVAGTSLFNGRMWARVLGVVLASLNLLAQFSFVSVYPLWSIIMMVVDVLVIYALTVHGSEAAIE